MVNGTQYECEKDGRLIDYLRDELRLTSVKEGCGEGACGTCTVLVDGKKFRACVLRLSKLDGKSITTVEGLSVREKEVYAYCFAEAGAVQCGFCIPGMVISAKSLLDTNLNPTREDVKKAIRGNICRCTGYQKIEDAILSAAVFFREEKEIPKEREDAGVSKRFRRVDAREKVLGTGEFVDDVILPGMIYAKALRSRYPRARVERIDLTKALAHPDVVRILTAQDVPVNKCGHIKKDWDVMIAQGEITRYIGDAVALVATGHKETLDEVLSLIEVDYTELTPVTSPEEALKEDAPKIHPGGNILTKEVLRRGDADAAIAASKYVVTKKYSVPFTDHAFMEPECAIAFPEGEDGVHLYTAAQSVYDEQKEIAYILGIPEEKVHSESKLVGGGFGGKEDMSVQHHAALMAWVTKRPVKVKFSREESLRCHVKRHAMEMEFTTACDEEGRLTGMKALIYSDTGAYASLGGPVLQRACTHAAGPYHYQNVDITGIAAYTNNIPAGAYRGFGVTQSCFAMECNLNLLAEMAGLSPWEIRFKNAVVPGDVLPNGQIVTPDCALRESLLAVKEEFESSPYAGIACCLKNSGVGVGLKDIGRCRLSLEGGTVHIQTSAACMGQGVGTVCIHIVCETTGLPPELFIHERADTARTPDSGTSTASRQTLFTGEAARRAALALKEALTETEKENPGCSVQEAVAQLEGRSFYGEYLGVTDPMGSPKPNPVSHIAYGYATQVVILNEDGKVKEVVAAHDAGTVINPQSAEGQIEGGVVMGLGYGFTEDFPMEGGYPKLTYGKLGLFRATDAPRITVKFVNSGTVSELAYGAKGIGEICSVPTAPACQGAYYRYDGIFRTRLPLEKTSYKK